MRTSQRIRRLLDVDIVDDWTRNFCESLLQQVIKGRRLSHRQIQILEDKEREYSEDRVQKEADWVSSWDDDKAEIFRICALYYRTTQYFTKITQVLTSDGQLPEGYVPSRRAYKKICENKFAMKIRDGWFGEPKYPAGTAVALRTNAEYPGGATRIRGPRLRRHVAGNPSEPLPYFVLEANSRTPVSSCKGSKIYKLLAAGSAEPIEIEERHIKNLRRKKKK